MNRRFFFAVILALVLAFCRPSASAQAAAESVLLNANSAAVGAKAGSSLGSVLNRVNKQLGGQVSQTTSQPASGTISPGQPQSVPTQSATGSTSTEPVAMITSIKGGASSCASTNPLPPAPGDTKAESPQPNCGVNNSASKPASQKYKSVMTVSFPK